MELKRGQVSIFLLMALVVLVAFFLLSYLGDKKMENKPGSEFSFAPVENYVNNCLKIIAEDSLLVLGWQGGLVRFNENRMMITHYSTITYSYFEGKNTFPSVSEMEEEMESYINANLNNCLKNSSSLQGWEPKLGNMKSEVSISNKSVIFNVYPQLSFSKQDTTREISALRIEVPVRLLDIYNSINEVMQLQTELPGFIPYTFLQKMEMFNSVYLHRENNFVYEFIDEDSRIQNRPYQFIVANRFVERDVDEIL